MVTVDSRSIFLYRTLFLQQYYEQYWTRISHMRSQLPRSKQNRVSPQTASSSHPHLQFVCHSSRKVLIEFHHIYFYRANNGTRKHEKKHRCTPETRLDYKCPKENELGAWATSDEEYIKFAARLIFEKEGAIRDRTIERYKNAWKMLHPDDDVPLTSGNEPIDFLWDMSHPCHRIPWMGAIPRSASLTSKF